MSQRYALTPAALDDLFEIWHYVVDQSGSMERADLKLAELYATFELLADSPGLATRRRSLPDGVLAFPKLGYVIAFRQRSAEIEIIRVTGSELDFASIE